MADYHVGCGITAIFAGTLNKKNGSWINKSDVTNEAFKAVAQYCLEHDEAMNFTYNGKRYRLCVVETKAESEDIVMKWIDAEQQVTVTIYDEEHEEHLDKKMTVEEMLDTYTNEGCPTIHSNPERKPGKWVHMVGWWECNQCHAEYTDMPTCMGKVIYEYCPMCGVKMEVET